MQGLPVHELLGGMVRNYCECYNTAGIIPGITEGMSVKERAHATIEAGYRAFRFGAVDTPANTTFNTRERVTHLRDECAQAREGVGKNGDWVHRFPPALRPRRRHPRLRRDRGSRSVFRRRSGARRRPSWKTCRSCASKVNVPLAAGEEWGNRWDFNKLVEDHDIDYVRATLPNVGGITEMMKIAAICETHFVGIVPHFTGPIATAALVNSLGTFSRAGADGIQLSGTHLPHLPVCLDFKDGKLYPNERPGLGVELDMNN